MSCPDAAPAAGPPSGAMSQGHGEGSGLTGLSASGVGLFAPPPPGSEQAVPLGTLADSWNESARPGQTSQRSRTPDRRSAGGDAPPAYRRSGSTGDLSASAAASQRIRAGWAARRPYATADEWQRRLAAVRERRGLPPKPSARERAKRARRTWSIVAAESAGRDGTAREEERYFDTEAEMERHVSETCVPGAPIAVAHTRTRGSSQMHLPPASPESSPGNSPKARGKVYDGPYCRLFPGVRPEGKRGPQWLAVLESLLGGEAVETALTQKELLDVLAALKSVATKEPPCPTITVSAEPDGQAVMIVGDLHGQRADLLQSVLGPFLRGDRPPAQLLFLGDYVDRGPDGVGVLAVISLLKVLFPSLVTVLRGNHEDPSVNSVYGFYNECDTRYPVTAEEQQEIWARANVAFAALPVAAVVEHAGGGGGGTHRSAATGPTSSRRSSADPAGSADGSASARSGRRRRIFCCHGGLCPALVPEGPDGECSPRGPGEGALNKIASVDRFMYGGEGGQPPEETKDVLDGLLWSDPTDVWFPSLFKDSVRGTGWQWGPDASRFFCERNKFDIICRAHECVMEGVRWSHDGLVVTVFSAANYCGSSGNRGGVLHVSTDWSFSTVDYEAAEGKTAADMMSQPLLKYFRPGMEPVQLPRIESSSSMVAQRQELDRLKADAVGREDFAEAGRVKRVLSALLLATDGGQWNLEGVDFYSLPDGVQQDDAGRVTMSFSQVGGTVVGTYSGCNAMNEQSIRHASDAGLAVGVAGKQDLTIRGDEFTYDGKMNREGSMVTGQWVNTEGEKGNFTLTRLPPA